MSGVIMTGRRRALVVAATVAALMIAAAVVLVGLRGNGSEVAATPTVSPSPTSSAAPSPSPTQTATVAVPELPAAAKSQDLGGAEAFFKYFIEVYNYSFSSLDPDPMTAISAKGCKFCGGVVSDVRRAAEQGLRYDGAQLHVKSQVASSGVPTEGLIVAAILNQDEGRTISSDGGSRTSVEASESVRMDAGLRWVNGGWQVFAVTLPTSK